MTSVVSDFSKPLKTAEEQKKSRAEKLGQVLSDKTGRFLSATNRGIVSLPDMLANAISGGGYLFPKDPFEKGLRTIGSIGKQAPAQTRGDKLIESFGETLGSLAVPGGVAARGAGTASKALGRALLGTKGPLISPSQLANPTFASTAGGSLAQALAQPLIEETFPDSPTAQLAASFGTGLLGGAASGAATSSLLGKAPTQLPLKTAAQRGDINTDLRARELTARQLDLGKTDPKSADIIDKINKEQQAAILEKLESGLNSVKEVGNNISGSKVIDDIANSIENLKDVRRQEYQKASMALIDQNPNVQINVENTLAKLKSLGEEVASGSSLEEALGTAKNLVNANVENPRKLISAKSAIQDMTDFGNKFSLGKQQSSVLNEVVSELNKDIESSLPGYGEMNTIYSQQTKNLEKLLKGIAGKAGRLEGQKPSEVISQIFEKTDPELVGQLREVISPEVYNQAADLYLANLAEDISTKPSWNEVNKINKFKSVYDVIFKNQKTLKQTLPERQSNIVDEVIKDFETMARGTPRDEFTVHSYRGLAKGDEVKNLGKKSLLKNAGDLALKAIGGKGLLRNEMLTGQSPTSQMAEYLGNAAPRAAQKFATANVLSEPNPQEMVSNLMQSQPQGQMIQQPTGPDPLDAVMEQFNLNQSQQPQLNNGISQKTGDPLDNIINQLGLQGGRKNDMVFTP